MCMNFDVELFFCALGLACIIEGLPWALFPQGMRKVLLTLAEGPLSGFRRMGLMAIAAGLGIIWLTRYFVK